MMTEQDFRDKIATLTGEARKNIPAVYIVGILEAVKFYILAEAR